MNIKTPAAVGPLRAVSFSLLLLLLLTLVACEHQTPITAPPVQVQPTLSSIQANIFTPKCAIPGCHVPGGGGPMSLQAGASFNNLVNVNSVTSNPAGVRVVPNNAANSILYLRVSGNTRGAQMPTTGQKLSATELTAIQTWINNGAQNN